MWVGYAWQVNDRVWTGMAGIQEVGAQGGWAQGGWAHRGRRAHREGAGVTVGRQSQSAEEPAGAADRVSRRGQPAGAGGAVAGQGRLFVPFRVHDGHAAWHIRGCTT